MFNNFYFSSCTYSFLDGLFYGLKNSESWRGKTLPHVGFSKEDKEALNALTFVILAPIFEKEHGIKCDMVRFPLFLLKRLCFKYYLWDSKPKNKKDLKKRVIDFEAKKEKYVYECLCKDTNEHFAEWLFFESEMIDPDTVKCFNIAKSLATAIEFEELKHEMRPDVSSETEDSIRRDLDLCALSFPFIDDIVYKNNEYRNMKSLLHSISWARYTFRWQRYHSPIRCSILTHMLESAFLAYFMFIEENMFELQHGTETRKNELMNELSKSFIVMLFHDVAEIWTDDIPSPAKDGMGIRKESEEQELAALTKHFYSKLPDFVCHYFMNGIMMEDDKNADMKPFYKSADYFSADMEVYWNIVGGCRDHRFYDILNESFTSKKRTEMARHTLKKYLSSFNGINFF